VKSVELVQKRAEQTKENDVKMTSETQAERSDSSISHWPLANQDSATTKIYHELSENPVIESSPLELLQKNLEQLSETHARYRFIMREIRYLMKV
jgi:hypothetical protein